MQFTTRRKIPFPDLNGDDTPVDLPQLFHDRAILLDSGVDIDDGPLSSRPISTSGSPGLAGRQFVVTDQAGGPRLDLDIGVGWVTVGPGQVDAAPGVPSLRTLGTGPQQAVAGNDARLIGGGNATGDLTGVYPGPMTVSTWNGQSKAAVVAGSPPQTHGSSHLPAGADPVTGLTDASIAAGNKDGAAGTASMRTLGGGAQQAMPGNATPTPGAHAPQHKYSGSDPLVSLTPTLKSGNYVAVVGDLVIMSGSNNVITLPNAPAVDGAQCAVLAVTAVVTVNRAGTDTITTTSQGQLTINVAQGTSVVFTYHSGVWYGLVSGSGGGATGLVSLNPPSRAYRASPIAVNSTATKIPVDTKSYDPTGTFDVTTNSRFTCQSAGYYQVDASITLGSTAVNQIALCEIWKNGVQLLTGTLATAGATAQGLTSDITDVLQLNAGDYLELYAYSASNLNLSGSGSGSNYLTVAQVAQVGSPPAGQGMGVVARAYRNATMTLSSGWTKIPLDTKSYDPNGSIDLTNGRYVAPATGYYQIDAQVSVQGETVATDLVEIGIQKNGVTYAQNIGASAASSGGYASTSISDVVSLQAGDIIELYGASVPSGIALFVGIPALNFLSVVQVAGAATFGALSPTAQSAAYTAGAGQLVLMTGANAVALPAGPVPGSQVEVMALTAQVPVNRSGTDTINNAGVAGLQSVTVNAGQAIIFSYLGGVWYASPAGAGQSLAPPARAYLNTVQAGGMLANGNTKLLIDTKSFDSGGNFDVVTNHRYVAPSAGLYAVEGQVSLSGSGAAPEFAALIYKNGVQVSQGSLVLGPGNSLYASVVSDVLQLNAGDYLELWCNNQTATAVANGTGVDKNFLAVHQIGVIGAPTPGQGQATVARAWRNAALVLGAGANTKIPVDTLNYDPGNNMQVASGRYVCPTSGYYKVTGQATPTSTAANQQCIVFLYHNGSPVSSGSESISTAASQDIYSTATDIIFCQAGDVIELYVFCTTSLNLHVGAGYYNFLTVEQVAGTNLIGALSPTAQSAAYNAGAGQRVLMTGANAVNLPSAPMAGSTVAVNALTGVVPVNRTGSDTINKWGTAGLAGINVAPGSSVELQYLNGVWYVIRGLETKPRVRANAGGGQACGSGASIVITGLAAGAADIAGGMVASGNGFAAPVSGTYRFSGQITLTQINGAMPVGSYAQALLFVNGVSSGVPGIGTSPTIANQSYITPALTDMIHLNAGDVVTLGLQQNASGFAITTNGASLQLEYVSQ